MGAGLACAHGHSHGVLQRTQTLGAHWHSAYALEDAAQTQKPPTPLKHPRHPPRLRGLKGRTLTQLYTAAHERQGML